MSEDSFNAQDLGRCILQMLGVRKGEVVEIQRNKLDPNEIKVLRHPTRQGPKLT